MLRSILTNNPDVESFSVERILAAIGHEHIEMSLLMFSLPGIVPVPRPGGIVALPTGVIALQLATGQKQIKLPRFILNKSVSRRALAVAIHAMLPVLEAAERIVRPRWSWVNHPLSRRAIGLFVFLLAVAIAYPFFGSGAFHAMSIFVIGLGMVEHDGLAVVLGLVVGVLSLAMLAASSGSLRAIRAQAGKLLRKLGRKLGLAAFARQLAKRGHHTLAAIFSFEWSQLLMRWDPETRANRPAPLLKAELGVAARSVASRTPSQAHRAHARVARKPALC